MKKCKYFLLIPQIFLSNHSLAQQIDAGTVFSQLENRLELEAILNENGQLTVVPKGGSAPYIPAADDIGWAEIGVEPIWQFQDGTRLNFDSLGDWYFTAEPNDEIIGVEAGQFNTGIGTAEALRNAPNGSTSFKAAAVNVLDAMTFSVPDEGLIKAKMRDLVTETLNAMVLQGQSQVCSWPSRPETFEVNAKISVELGIGGEIELKTNWNTERLCANTDND